MVPTKIKLFVSDTRQIKILKTPSNRQAPLELDELNKWTADLTSQQTNHFEQNIKYWPTCRTPY